MRAGFLLPAVLGAAMLGAPAMAETPADNLRCMLVSNAFVETEPDAGRKQLAMMSAHYFLGRIDGRLTPPQLLAQITAVTKTLIPATMAATMNACVTRVRAAQKIIQDVGRQIEAQKPKK